MKADWKFGSSCFKTAKNNDVRKLVDVEVPQQDFRFDNTI